MAIAANLPNAAVDPANAVYINQGDEEPVRMESLCMNCHDNVRLHLQTCLPCHKLGTWVEFSTPVAQGTTTMLLTSVPHFRDIMVASFECEHCNFR